MTLEDYQNGQVLLVDKDLEWTSFDAVAKLRSALRNGFKIKKIKIGHAGTLDPMATGLLIICTGKFTKQINNYMGLEKTYTGTIYVGATSPTYDTESEPDTFFPTDHITPDLLESVRQQFEGEQMQTPPIFSAVKVGGKSAYTLARRGKDVELEPRPITIYGLEFTRVELPEIDFKVTCSKGTYIRSLANDIGVALGSGAYLIGLRRTAIGDIQVSDALSVQDHFDKIWEYAKSATQE